MAKIELYKLAKPKDGSCDWFLAEDHNNPATFLYQHALSLPAFRQIIAEEWGDIVEEYDLRPGNITEKFTGRVLKRLMDLLPE